MASSALKTLLVLLVLVVFVIPTVSFAADALYESLAPLGGIAEGTLVNPSSYIVELLKLLVGIASGLAVLAIAYGGIKYMMSDVVTSKSDAIQQIKNALLGLLLAVSAWLILFTINRSLTTPELLQGLDVGATTPGPARTVTRYESVYYNGIVELRYWRNEYELLYTANPSNQTIKQRYSTNPQCTAAGQAIPISGRIGMWSCNIQRVCTNDPTTNSNIPLAAPCDTEPYKSELFADRPQCYSFKNGLTGALPPPYSYNFITGWGCGDSLVADRTQNSTVATYTTAEQCNSAFTTLTTQGMVFEPGRICNPIYN